MIALNEFLKKFKIDRESFDKSNISWNTLKEIYQNYTRSMYLYEEAAKYVLSLMSGEDVVNSLKYRVKDPEHLLEKIIRKKLENPGMDINENNYKEVITDLAGVRIMHVFKEEWQKIHEIITSRWKLERAPKAYIGNDAENSALIGQLESSGFKVMSHEAGYRSMHYIIAQSWCDTDIKIELQVRTLFEEGWSEIDHKLRYPYNTNNIELSMFLQGLNSYASNMDNLSTYLNDNFSISKKGKKVNPEKNLKTFEKLRFKFISTTVYLKNLKQKFFKEKKLKEKKTLSNFVSKLQLYLD